MPSWRDDASPETQRELDDLLDAALGFAQHELAQRGEFFPYGAMIDQHGEPKLVAVRPSDSDDQPPAADVLDSTLAALVEQREGVRSAALVSDVSIPGGDAIRVDLEHREGHALTVLLPYSKSSRGPVDFGEIRAQEGRARVWATA